MTLIRTAWSWKNGTPHERADTVRRHASSSRPIPEHNLRSLFNLTEDGLRQILAGDDWRPAYDSDGETAP
jgi:hypothetical protein